MAVAKRDERIVERESHTKGISEIAAFLRDALGQQVTAHLAGNSYAKLVSSWANGRVSPRREAEQRLRNAYRIVRMIAESFDSTTAKSWLLGCNSRLDDEAPATLLARATEPEDFRVLIQVARAFSLGAD